MSIWTRTTKDIDLSIVLKTIAYYDPHCVIYVTYKDKYNTFKPTAGQLININSN